MVDHDKETIEAGTEEILGLSQAAKLLSVHRNTLRNWSNNGMIKAYRLGSRGDRRFVLSELLEFLQSRTAKLGDREQDHASATGASRRR